MGARIEHLTTSGTFSLDGGTWEVDNNVWIVGDDTEVVVIDAPHDADAIAEAVGDRTLKAIVCTHAHDDHVREAPKLSARTGAPVLLHPDDLPMWELTHPRRKPDGELNDGRVVEVAGIELQVLHTPGHAPGAVCLYAPALGVVFTGDTLFPAVPAPPAGRSPTTRRSWTPSGADCSPCRSTRSCTPATGRAPPSPRRPPASTRSPPAGGEGPPVARHESSPLSPFGTFAVAVVAMGVGGGDEVSGVPSAIRRYVNVHAVGDTVDAGAGDGDRTAGPPGTTRAARATGFDNLLSLRPALAQPPAAKTLTAVVECRPLEPDPQSRTSHAVVSPDATRPAPPQARQWTRRLPRSAAAACPARKYDSGSGLQLLYAGQRPPRRLG